MTTTTTEQELPKGIDTQVDLDGAKRAVILTNGDAQAVAAQKMLERGGSFVQAIARAYTYGDTWNRHKLADAFADYFVEYAEMAGVFMDEAEAAEKYKREEAVKSAAGHAALIVIETAEAWADKHPDVEHGKSVFVDAVCAILEGKGGE